MDRDAAEAILSMSEHPEPLFEGDNGPDPDDVEGDPGEFEEGDADPQLEDEEGLHELDFNRSPRPLANR